MTLFKSKRIQEQQNSFRPASAEDVRRLEQSLEIITLQLRIIMSALDNLNTNVAANTAAVSAAVARMNQLEAGQGTTAPAAPSDEAAIQAAADTVAANTAALAAATTTDVLIPSALGT